MAAIIATTLLVILVQDIPLSLYLQNVQRDRIVTGLERDAFVLAGRSEEALEQPSVDSATMITDIARSYQISSGARVIIVNSAGIAIVTGDADDSRVGADYSSRPEIASALAGQIASGTRFSKTLSQELLYVSVPVFNGMNVLGAVRLTYPASVVNDAVTSQLSQLWIVALTTVILAGIVGLIFASGVTRRLTRLRAVTERVSEGHLDERAEEVGAPELKSLSRSFNVMAARLEGLIAQQRAFAADASHQLRTPLTALRLKLERARSLIGTDPEGAARRLTAAEAETDRLSQVIEGLLLLSRSEASSTPTTVHDLSATARERVEHWMPLADESHVRITFEGPDAALVLAIPTAIEQVIDNYIDNAIAVSPAGSTITVRVSQLHSHVSLHVLDAGPGLTAEECALAFDRFWRADQHTDGSGLGLAIVAQLASASGATARLAPRAGGGLDASVTFAKPRD